MNLVASVRRSLAIVALSAIGCSSQGESVRESNPADEPTDEASNPPVPAERVDVSPKSPAPTLPPWAQPEECVPSDENRSTGHCRLDLRCAANEVVRVYCVQEPTGAYSCDCAYSTFSARYALRNADETSACDVTRDVCLAGPTEFTGAEECAPVALSDDSSVCRQQTVCTRDVAERDGISVALQTSSSFEECYELGVAPGAPPSDVHDCRCVSSTGTADGTAASVSIDVAVTGASPERACGVMHELCDDVSTSFPDDPACEEVRTPMPDGCQIQVPCTWSRSWPEAVQAEYVETHGAYCQTAEGETSTCTCAGSTLDSPRVTFVVQGATAGFENCNLALSLCASEAALELDGTSACTPTSQSVTDGCDASFTCTLGGTAGGRSVELEGYLTTRCSLLEDNAWLCKCTSGFQTAEVTVNGADPDDACLGAARTCQDLGAVEVGSRGPLVQF